MSAIALAALGLAPPPPASAQTTPAELEYREGHREAAIARRAEFMRRMEGGLAVITSADRSEPNLYEFYTPDTEHHDFLFLTGIYTQLRFKPVASDLARGWGDTRKILYVNYPRVTNLSEPAQPRVAFVERLRAATSELDVRDAGDLLDRQRMILDDFALKNVRRAVEITGKGLAEGMKVARPGLTTRQVMETVDYVYRLHGADLGFDTLVGVASGLDQTIRYASTREEAAARGGDARITDGILVHFDTGARINHYSADVQRTVPAGDRFTGEQSRVYEMVLNVQKAVIAAVRPGVTWQELHDLAVRMLREAGGWDESYTYGIGHYIGMEVHEHGVYTEPLVPGMALAIEQGAIVNGTRVAFEDDVLVTADGHEWLTRSIPIEIAEVEALRKQPLLVRPEDLLKKR